jgi:hypothetical protein
MLSLSLFLRLGLRVKANLQLLASLAVASL